MRLILLGPPGAGKGTQAKLLAEKLHLPHISTGDILRDEVRENSALGKRVAEYLQSGELVPDDIVIEVVMNRLAKADSQDGFILDGFPRTPKQAVKLDAALKQQELSIDLVIYFETNPEVSIRRLSGRRVCKNCGANFHTINLAPKQAGICDFCGGELFLRDDDKEETVKKRLLINKKQTASLVAHYKKTRNLKTVSGDLEAEQVYAQLLDLFVQKHLLND